MWYGNDFSHYQAENILQTPQSPAHSGPELCYATPDLVLADKLAREIISTRVKVVDIGHDSGAGLPGGCSQEFKLGLR